MNPHEPAKPITAKTLAAHGFMVQPDETLLVVVRRTIVGIVLLYLEVLIGVVVLIGFFTMVSPGFIQDLNSGSNLTVIGLVILALAILVFFLFVATYAYRENRLYVTDKSIIEVSQSSLFSRKVSRLDMADVEDVSAEQKGILPTVFGYGVLFIQTAGEKPNFTFAWCPDPNKYANQILIARQQLSDEKGDPA